MTRDQLIEAMRRQYYGHEGAYERMLDAVLPLITDAIEAQGLSIMPESQYKDGLIDGCLRSARLVRSLGGAA